MVLTKVKEKLTSDDNLVKKKKKSIPHVRAIFLTLCVQRS